MEKIGRIISTNGNVAKIEILRTSACGEKCSSCKVGCSKTGMYIDVENTVGATPSQFVKVKVETKIVMKVAFLVYIVPLFMLIVGIVSGSYIHQLLGVTFSAELFSFLLGMIFMGLSYGVVRKFDQIYKSKEKIKYEIIKIL
ncbi:SoxR reducing system RseC family protein [Crassaminicella thermophila]|uniref:SoxR reducing system RseC family protein n=1 Tax=Crassaminicella thermophila TaxID=2599308 RepID=A0A5C0SIS8_CRATE|nr:SoxR reducing system RseC family protein [Crassaminicella thermophila]QEK13344.1 SoxR reducing system RseC family protein [Crassaminicella thermophila]